MPKHKLTPADTLSLSKSLPALKAKLDDGLDPSAQDTMGDTVLHYALRGSSSGAQEVVNFLLRMDGLDLAVSNKKGGTVLGSAVMGGNVDAAKQLLARGAKLSQTENPLYYMAHTQCGRGSYEAAKLVLEHSPLDEKRIRVALERAKEEGDKRLIALLGGAPAPRDAKKPSSTRPAQKKRAPEKLKLDKKKLGTSKARETALDAIGKWFVEALLAAGSDRKLASDVIAHAIASFYDVREAAGQERGEYAGHFFMVDAVGLGDTDRPVPWELLGKKASPKDLELWQTLFDKVEPKVR